MTPGENAVQRSTWRRLMLASALRPGHKLVALVLAAWAEPSGFGTDPGPARTGSVIGMTKAQAVTIRGELHRWEWVRLTHGEVTLLLPPHLRGPDPEVLLGLKAESDGTGSEEGAPP